MKIDMHFLNVGFERSMNEPTLYVKKHGCDFLVVCLYVDDMVYMGTSNEMLVEFRKSMINMFDMTNLGELHYFLGLEVKQIDDGIFVSQEKYARELVKRFNLLDSKVASTPMNMNEKLHVDDGSGMVNVTHFRSIVGGLNYLTHTRPDLAYCVSVVSRFMHCPSKLHLGAAKRILRYVSGTLSYGLWYSSKADGILKGFTDSDWAGELDGRKSTSGYVFNIGSAAITWKSKKQEVVALSSAEAEYVAASSAICEALWLKRMLGDLKMNQDGAVKIHCDSKSAIAMSKNPAFHGRTKHIDVKFHFIRSKVSAGEVELQQCCTHDQVADIFTKALPCVKFNFFRYKLGVCSFESRGSVEE